MSGILMANRMRRVAQRLSTVEEQIDELKRLQSLYPLYRADIPSISEKELNWDYGSGSGYVY